MAVHDRHSFPTTDQVEKASLEDLARWYRFSLPADANQKKTLDRVAERLRKLGGMSADGGLTPELSRKIGYGGVKTRT